MEHKGVLLYSPIRRPPYIYVADFLLFYKLGKIAGSDQRFHIYDQDLQREWNNRLISPLHTDKVLYAPYVPWLCPLLIPLGALPLKESYFVWCLSTLMAGLVALAFLIKDLYRSSTLTTALFLCATMASLPAWYTVMKGQSTWLILGLCCLFYWAFTRNRDLIAGISLALLSQKPQYAIFFAVPALARKRWKIIATGLFTEALLLIMSGFAIGWDNVFAYPKILLTPDSIYHDNGVAPPTHMVAIRALLSIMLPQSISMTASLVLMFGMLAVLWQFWRKTEPEANSWLMAVTITTSLLFSPHTYLYDCLLIALAAVLGWNPAVGTEKLPRGLLLFRFLMITYPLTSWCLYFSENVTALLPNLAFTVLNLLILIALFLCRPKL